MKLRLLYIFFLFFFTLVPLSSQDIINVPMDFSTLQEAVNSANPNDIILISEGEFYGFTIINKPLTIKGAGKEKTILYYYDETSSKGISPGVINYAKVAIPVIKIETLGKVVIKDIEIRGALKEFIHLGTTTFGIISHNSDLELNNIHLRRLRNIGVWVNMGSLLAVDVNFADDLGFMTQADLGFHLSNLSQATFLRLTQLQNDIDHTINIHNDKDWDNISRINIEDTTIAASALYWGDCIRSYGGTNITISNSSFYRDAGGAPEGDSGIGNTGISFNGNRSSLYISNTSFTNLPRGINLYTSLLGDQFYQIVIEESSFDTFEKSAVYVTGKGKADIDLGGGQLGSKGNNRFLPENSKIFINKDNAELNIYLPDQSLENIYLDPAEDVLEEVQITGSEIQLLRNGSSVKSITLNGLILNKALLADEFILASYHYPDGVNYLGLFDKNLVFESEYNMGNLQIIEFSTNGDTILCQYKNEEGLNYIGTFTNSLEFIAEYWFYSSVTIINSYLEDDRVIVKYGYNNGQNYAGYFSNKMKYIKSISID